jgi:hypothetical protein
MWYIVRMIDENITDEECRQLLDEAINVLRGIIGGCVHPETAFRAVMVDLKPIRKILGKIEKSKKSENSS